MCVSIAVAGQFNKGLGGFVGSGGREIGGMDRGREERGGRGVL